MIFLDLFSIMLHFMWLLIIIVICLAVVTAAGLFALGMCARMLYKMYLDWKWRE